MQELGQLGEHRRRPRATHLKGIDHDSIRRRDADEEESNESMPPRILSVMK
jgi:hypothetical protein